MKQLLLISMMILLVACGDDDDGRVEASQIADALNNNGACQMQVHPTYYGNYYCEERRYPCNSQLNTYNCRPLYGTGYGNNYGNTWQWSWGWNWGSRPGWWP